MKKINEYTLNELESNFGLDEFYPEDYTLDGLNNDKVLICGCEYYYGDILKQVDPIAFNQVVLDFTNNLLEDEAIEETKDGKYVWTEDIGLEELGLKLNL